MSSRSKKKNLNREKSVDNKSAPQEKVELKDFNSIFNVALVFVLVVLFFLIILSSLYSVSVKLDLEEVQEDGEYSNFTVSALDILIAPIRGINSGYRFSLEKVGISATSSESWESIEKIINDGAYVSESTKQAINVLGIFAYVTIVCMVLSYISIIVCGVISRRKGKKDFLSLLICSGIFALIVAIIFISMIVIYIKSSAIGVSVTTGWGIWLIGLFAAITLGGCIANMVINKNMKVKNENL